MRDLEETLGIGACDLPTIRKYQPIKIYEVIKYALKVYYKQQKRTI